MSTLSRLVPLNGFVTLKPIETTESMYGNIVLPDIGSEKPEMGEVVGISPTYNYHKGENIPSALTIGQTVLIPKMGSMKITVDGEEFFITKETEILGYLA